METNLMEGTLLNMSSLLHCLQVEIEERYDWRICEQERVGYATPEYQRAQGLWPAPGGWEGIPECPYFCKIGSIVFCLV